MHLKCIILRSVIIQNPKCNQKYSTFMELLLVFQLKTVQESFNPRFPIGLKLNTFGHNILSLLNSLKSVFKTS